MKYPYYILLATVSLLSACAPTEEVWTGTPKNTIQVKCGQQCKTVYFGDETLTRPQKYSIHRFIRTGSRNHTIFVSACVGNSNPEMTKVILSNISQYIVSQHRHPVEVNPTLPNENEAAQCINLVRGKLELIPPNCPNNSVTPSVQNIGSDFGCATTYNLAKMINNPWDLLRKGQDTTTRANRMDYHFSEFEKGKSAKLDMESSS